MKLSGGWITAVVAALSLAAPATAAAQLKLPPILSPPSGGGGTRPAPLPQLTAGSDAVAERTNALHNGYSTDDSLIPPLRRRWKKKLGSGITPPLAAGGHVFFATVRSGAGIVYALDRSTGRTLWKQPVGSDPKLAYDGGLLFVADSNGAVAAYSAATGHRAWSRGYPGANRIVAAKGRLYLNALNPGEVRSDSQWHVVALEGSNGAQVWSHDTDASGQLAFDGSRVIVGATCNTRALDATGGAELWHYWPGCSGGEDYLPVIDSGLVYAPAFGDPRAILDLGTGRARGTYPGAQEPVIFGGQSIAAAQGRLRATNALTGGLQWSYRPRGPIDCSLGCSSPIAAGQTVWFTAGRRLYGVDRATGRARFRSAAAERFSNADHLSAGSGLLFAATGKVLSAYSSLVSPSANGIAENTVSRDLVEVGGALRLYGAVGHNLRARGRQHVTLLADRFPYGRFKAAKRTVTRSDGGFSFRVTPNRNTRYRTQVGAAKSRGGRIYVLPRFRAHLGRGRGRRVNRIHARVVARGPRDVRLRGRRVYLYLVSVHRRRVIRLGRARLHRSRRGRTRATIRFKALRHVGRRDFLFYCVPHLSRKGLGPRDYVDRHCGARRLRY